MTSQEVDVFPFRVLPKQERWVTVHTQLDDGKAHSRFCKLLLHTVSLRSRKSLRPCNTATDHGSRRKSACFAAKSLQLRNPPAKLGPRHFRNSFFLRSSAVCSLSMLTRNTSPKCRRLSGSSRSQQ